jgi:hypothetical protein
MPTCPLPGGVSPLGDIALRAPLDARVCTKNPPKVRGLWPLAVERAAGARVGLREEAPPRSNVQPSSRKAQKLKVHSPGLRALAAGSAPSAARAVDSRCLRLFSFFCQSCRCFLDYFSIVAPLGPESAPLICGLHGSMRWGAVRLKQR